MKYNIISKITLWVLFIIGAIISTAGVVIGFLAIADNLTGELMLDTTYVYASIALVAVGIGVLVIGGINNPKSLLKIFICLAASACIIAITYFVAPGKEMTAEEEKIVAEAPYVTPSKDTITFAPNEKITFKNATLKDTTLASAPSDITERVKVELKDLSDVRDELVSKDNEERFTNTVIFLTYLLIGSTLIALVAGWIIGAVRK